MSMRYEWKEVELRWQMAWRDSQVFATPDPPDDGKGISIFAAAPFTSGSAHMGHVRSYTIADAYARFRRAYGDPVLFSMGFDAFGLPAELGALGAGVQPLQWVEECSKTMRGQFDAMGFSFDWGRTFVSSDEDMYRWSQWLFVTLLEHDMIYEKDARVDWCESCHTVLARSQVEEGRCWRCSGVVTLVNRRQWFLRASKYFMENEKQLEGLLEWDKNSLGSQRAVLGRVDGIEIEARTVDERSITVFTPDVENVSAAAFVAISPSHCELDAWIADDSIAEELKKLRSGGWLRSDRKADEVVMIDTTFQVAVPGASHMLPVIISPYVDPRFGPTAILGVPDEDVTAEVIAQRLRAQTGSPMQIAKRPVQATKAVRFSAADFPISRQRGWGAPIPLVHCDQCGVVPVPVEQLPVELPKDLEFTGAGNPLAEQAEFVACLCPTCGGDARRDSDTLDCHVDALWIWIPACVPASSRAREMFTHPQIRNWLPINQIIWGLDGGSYILSQRTTAKMLRDVGTLDYIADGEPFARALMHGMVKYDGRKMSKHLGNVVDPNELIEHVGADTVRLAVLYAAAPKNGMSWTERDVDLCHRFIKRLWRYACSRLPAAADKRGDLEIDTSDKLRRQLAKWCDTAIRKITRDLSELQMHRAARNVTLLLDRIEDYERRVIEQRGKLTDADEIALSVALHWLLQVISPLTPHIAEELWKRAGNEPFVSIARWPSSGDRTAAAPIADAVAWE
jgi:leucyl-tRNA synthetase